jgi:allantoin racemase
MPVALIINPNTSEQMSRDIQATAQRVFQPPWTFRVVNAPAGPESLESWRDYHLASIAILPLLKQHSDADGIVLACFGDPGLYLLKEVSSAPVVGIAEASMSIALLLGGKFGILAGMDRAVQLMDSMVRTYGLEARYAGTLALNMRVLDFETHPEETLTKLEHAGRELHHRGADVLLLGCAGLTAFAKDIEARLPVAVIDPVEAGCRLIQLLGEGGWRISHGGIYARPAPQRMLNLERLFTEEMITLLKNWEVG